MAVNRTMPQDQGVQDAETWREACAVFGEGEALIRLQAFRQELVEHLTLADRDEPDYAALREMAHRTTARAGILGFTMLADASAALDEATERHQCVTLALTRWITEAERAVQPAGGLTQPPQDRV